MRRPLSQRLTPRGERVATSAFMVLVAVAFALVSMLLTLIGTTR